jgi:glutathione synthase/RimK-type ligase-like ATP-grasp enzyme
MVNGNTNDSLCIIGQEKSESNLKLLEEAKKEFSSVFFVPIDSISIGFKEIFSITYRSADLLKFYSIFPRIPRHFCSYAYQLLSLFPSETFMPIKPISFLLADDRFFMLTVLRKRGIPTLDLQLTRSTNAAENIIDKSKFPVVIRSLDKKTGVTVNNKTEAKSVIDALSSLKQPILIEDLVKNMISVYVAGPNVLAAVRKKSKEMDLTFSRGRYKKHKLSTEEENLAIDAATAIDAHAARIDISINSTPKVINIDLNPNLITPSDATGINIPQKIIESVRQSYIDHKQKPMLVKFFEDAKSVVNDVLKTKNLL